MLTFLLQSNSLSQLAVPLWWGAMRLPVVGVLAEKWEARRRITEFERSLRPESVYDKLRCMATANRSRIEVEW